MKTNAMSKYIESTSRMLDPRSRDIAPDQGDLSYSTAQVRGIDQEQRTITAVVSTAAVDRYQEVVEPKAFTKWLNTFMENPVFLAGHQHAGFDAGEPTVIGHWVDLKVTDKEVIGTAKFADTPLADRYWQLYRDKHMRAFSVAWLTHKWEMREFELAPGVTKKIRVFTEVELVEISAVSVPANRDALVRAASLGITALAGDELREHTVESFDFDEVIESAIEKTLTEQLTKQLNAEPGGQLACLIADVVVAMGSQGNRAYGSEVDDDDDVSERAAQTLGQMQKNLAEAGAKLTS